jgi:RNAse (barnase) inhibitor barstar
MQFPFLDVPESWQRIDWQILQNGGFALYWRSTFLEEDIAWLKSEGYRLHEFDCTRWRGDINQLHDDFARSFSFPDYYGKNFDALDDCLTDSLEGEGFAIVLREFDSLWEPQSPETLNRAAVLLDVLARASHYWLLLGKPMLTLIQTEDPQLVLPRFGCVTAIWNPREWLNASRER